MEQPPQIVAILRALEERLTALMDMQTDPEGRVSQAQTDALRTYGMIAQISEVLGIQRDQILALSDAIAALVTRFVEHDRRVATQHKEELDILHALATAVDQAGIAERADAARLVLVAAEDERLAQIAHDADAAVALIGQAQLAAVGLVKRAVNLAEAELSTHATEARETIADAASEARDQIHQEKESE